MGREIIDLCQINQSPSIFQAKGIFLLGIKWLMVSGKPSLLHKDLVLAPQQKYTSLLCFSAPVSEFAQVHIGLKASSLINFIILAVM